MIQKQNEATPTRPEGTRPLDADFILLSFKDRLVQLKSEPAWQDRDRTAITLVHHPQLRVVLVALHEGAQLDPHTTDGPLTIQALEGTLEVIVGKNTYSLHPGEAVMVAGQVPHSVKASVESALLLTMGPGASGTF